MVTTLGADAPALSAGQKQATEIRRRRERLDTDLKSEWSAANNTEENVDHINSTVMDYRRLIITEIANAINMQESRAYRYLMSVSAWKVTHLLAYDQKSTKSIASRENLMVFKTDPVSFFESFLIQDDSWFSSRRAKDKDTMQWNPHFVFNG